MRQFHIVDKTNDLNISDLLGKCNMLVTFFTCSVLM